MKDYENHDLLFTLFGSQMFKQKKIAYSTEITQDEFAGARHVNTVIEMDTGRRKF
jgi:hypothetical protein